MVTRWYLTVVAIYSLLVLPSTHGDLYRWDTGQVIPGTEGIEPEPGAQLDHLQLEYADLHDVDLKGASFEASDLTNALLSDSDLTGANLEEAILTRANLRNTTLADANMAGAVLSEADLAHTVHRGFTAEQFYSTASYQKGDLRAIDLSLNNLTGWDFSQQDLTGSVFSNFPDSARMILTDADFSGANLTNAYLNPEYRYFSSGSNLTGANLKNAYLVHFDVPSATVDSTTVYNQWTFFYKDFDPVASGLTFAPSPSGDFDGNSAIDADDVDDLAYKIRNGYIEPIWWLPDEAFDLNNDSTVDLIDHRTWVHDLKRTWFGDADLNGEFNSGDLTQVFTAGKYETEDEAGWAAGDWNGDGVFDTSDVVTAFVDGGYERGPRTDAHAIPEPSGWLLMMAGAVLWSLIRQNRIVIVI